VQLFKDVTGVRFLNHSVYSHLTALLMMSDKNRAISSDDKSRPTIFRVTRRFFSSGIWLALVEGEVTGTFFFKNTSTFTK